MSRKATVAALAAPRVSRTAMVAALAAPRVSRTAMVAALAALVMGAARPAHAEPSTERAQIERDFASANELSLAGDLPAAIALYESLVQRGVRNEDLYLNLGNSLAEAGRSVDAIVAYERGLRIAPGDADIAANLAFVRGQLGSSAPSVPGAPEGEAAPADLVAPLVAHLPAFAFGIVAIVANALFFLGWLFRRRSASPARRRALALAMTVGILGLLASGLVLGGHAILASDPRAVVLESIELKEGPHERFGSAGQAPAGIRVRILREDAGWLEVQKPDGTSGWIRPRSLTRV